MDTINVDKPKKKPRVRYFNIEKLKPRHRKFVENYITYLEPRRAARAAGYKESNLSNTACLLMREPLIRQTISNRLKSMQMTKEDILAKYNEIIHKEKVQEKDVLHGLDSLSKITGLMRPDNQTNIMQVFHDIKSDVEDVISQQLNEAQDNGK